MKFHATMSEKKKRKTVAVVQKEGPFDKHSIIALRLLIPSVPPSELEFCKIIDLKYILRLILYSEMDCKITRQYSILIGTIPLRSAPSTPIASSSSSFAPQSTSKNENMTPKSNIVPSIHHQTTSHNDI